MLLMLCQSENSIFIDMSNNRDLDMFLSHFASDEGFAKSVFNQLVEDTSDDVAFKILARFRQTLTECKNQIADSLQSGDGDSIWKACHKVAGSSELLGFKSLGLVSRTLMKNIQASPEINNSNTSDLEDYLKTCDKIIGDIALGCPNLSSYL